MDDSKRDRQQIEAADLNGNTPKLSDEAWVLAYIAPLLRYASKQITPDTDGAYELYAAVNEITAWEARRDAKG